VQRDRRNRLDAHHSRDKALFDEMVGNAISNALHNRGARVPTALKPVKLRAIFVTTGKKFP
jgi:hypothetical protein